MAKLAKRLKVHPSLVTFASRGNVKGRLSPKTYARISKAVVRAAEQLQQTENGAA
jgi:hypothetical protein